MRVVKKSFFTLLELLVVLFIISLGLIATGVKIKDSYEEQRFLSESQQVLSQINMAQDLMLMMDTDVTVNLAHDPKTKQVTSTIDVEKPLPIEWERLIQRPLKLTAIHSFQFGPSKSDSAQLIFSLGSMSQGTLTLYEKGQDDSRREEKRQFTIELTGSPRPLGIKPTPVKEQDKVALSQLLYPQEVYEELYKNPSKEKTK